MNTKSNNTYALVPINRISAAGWIRNYLLAQKDGLTGHLEHAGYPFDTAGWRSDQLRLGDRGGSGWWPYEQYAYWVDGMIRCGLLLEDKKLKAKARRQIDYVLSRPDRDGYLGPESLKYLHGPHGSERWPHAVFFRSVIADFDERPSRAVLKKLVRHYVSGTAKHETSRNICNIEIMAWLYERTRDRRMLKLAEDSYRNFQRCESASGATVTNMLGKNTAKDHGPTYMELFKLGAIMFRLTGNKKFLGAAANAQKKLERDHVLIDGVPSATEHLRGIYSRAGHETCVVADYLWALGHLLQASGEVRYADAMERACFNALPGSVTPDFKALQYFSGPNQVVAGPQTNHHPHGIASAHTSYRPNPATECCPGNIHRAMPAYAARMWLSQAPQKIFAALYGPSVVRIGSGTHAVTIREETDYPFDPVVRFRFECRKPRRMEFSFRIPGWSRRTKVLVNGVPPAQRYKSGRVYSVSRVFKSGDVIELAFDHSLKQVRGPENSLAYTWGPLVFALPIKARRSIDQKDKRSSKEFPAWSLFPASPWNYGVRRGESSTIELRPPEGNPWEANHAPVRLMVNGYRIPGWRLEKKKQLIVKNREWSKTIKGNIQFTPMLPKDSLRRKCSGKPIRLELVPLGAARLRLTWFPVIP